VTERWHPDDGLLLAAALGDPPDDALDGVLHHLAACTPCRRTHAALLTGADLALPAVPRTAPPAGFEARALERLREESDPRGGRAGRERRAPRWLLAAAAALLGVAVGVTGVRLLAEPPEQPAVSAWAASLETADGEEVGRVARAAGPEGRRLVVVVEDEAPSSTVTCRLVLTDGSVHDVGRWSLDYDVRTWVVDKVPETRAVELVDEAGEVWARALL